MWLALVTLAVASISGGDVPVPQSVELAVREHLAQKTHAMSDSEKAGYANNVKIESIRGWPLQSRMADEELFLVTERGSSIRYSLVSVDKKARVYDLESRDDINELVRREGIRIADAGTAEEVARLFLSATKLFRLVDYGWELGVNVVRSGADIEYRNRDDQERVERSVVLSAPRIESSGGVFRFILFGWERVGTGAIKRYEVVLDEKAITGFTESRVVKDVGRWELLQ